MSQNRMLYIQNQTPPPSMHHKWKEIIDVMCKQPIEIHRDQLLTKSPLSWRINYCDQGCLILGSNPYLHQFKYRHNWAHLVNTQDQGLTAIRIYWSQLVILPSSDSHGNFATSSLPNFSTPSLRNVCSRVDALTSLFPRHHKVCKPDKHSTHN